MFVQRYQLKLKVQRQNGLYRNPAPIDKREGKYIYIKGARLLNFASNDYLGLGACRELHRKVADNFGRYGGSSSSSRLVSGNFSLFEEAEKAYAEYFGYEAALFFPSGYQANIAVLATLFEPGDTVVFDKHIHASSVKGLTLSGATAHGFNHSCFSHLEKRLEAQTDQVGVVTESLFSMDGDGLDVPGLMALKQRYAFFCVVDEAHAFGVLGPGGRGVAADMADVAVGTFGKALGLFGAFVLMPAELKPFLLNFASPQIYTTALPEAHAASALDVLNLVGDCQKERRHLGDLSCWCKKALRQEGYEVQGDAHILALKIGDEALCVEMAKSLLAKGIFILPARYPTVPLQQSILRISLTALHTRKDIEKLIECIREVHENH